MIARRSLVTIPLALILLAAAIPTLTTTPVLGPRNAQATVEPHAGMLRYPDVSATHIAFLYANNLWTVPKEGGVATPLTSAPGAEQFLIFSPDGENIAFMGNYDGDMDLYTIPVSGGTPFRVTHHPTTEVITDWTRNDKLIFWAYGMFVYPRAQELCWVSTEGGLPEKLQIPYGASAQISPDGQWLAYTPYSRDHRTWKRYRGGMATDIWLFHLKRHTSKKITDWEGTDTRPMWQGNDKIYYLSDAGQNHRNNIWLYDVKSGEKRQITHYKKYDVKWPNNGPGSEGQGEIVYQVGSELHLLDLGTEKAKTVEVTIPGDRPKLRIQAEQASRLMFDGDISNTGKRAAVEARGDVWTLPAKNGSVINLHRSSGTAERDPSWSPDGKWIAYFSDESGEYELCITQSNGRGEKKKLTNLKKGFLYNPTWSPDSKWIAFWDKAATLYLYNLETKKTRKVFKAKDFRRSSRISWSHDSHWFTFACGDGVIKPPSIWLYNVDEDKMHKVTSGMFSDTWPTFDREGKYLYLASQREISRPIYEDLGTTWIYSHTDRLYVVPLTKEIESPIKPESDEEEFDEEEEEEKADDKDKKKDEEKGKEEESEEGEAEEEEEEPEPLKIDIEDFERRMIALPAKRGNFAQLVVNDQGKLIYGRYPRPGEEGDASIHLLDLDEEEDDKKEKTVISGVMGYAMSADGKKLLAVKRNFQMAIINAKPDQKMKDVIDTSNMVKQVDPREEWRQIFMDAWRIQRDFFYDPNMHGVDWLAVRKQYEAMLKDCASREDVSFVIREMISELNVGHTYYWGGDVEEAPRVSIGSLGCDFERKNGSYRIKKIIEGGPWDVDARGPLSQPGVDVKEGDYLLAVNGVPVDSDKDPWAAFQGLANRTVTITVSEKPKMDDDARHVVVKLDHNEYLLRYRHWVEKNRKYVEDKSDGKVGYIYVPNTSIWGQNELVRQFYGQRDRQALIIDERWNGGGQVPTRFIELLNRPVANYWAVRDQGESIPWPPDAHHGPKCMLINGLAGSGGDYFPFWFREAGCGKLIGTRTWGGLVGISGNPRLVDGGYTSAPTFAFFEKDGTWGIEGHGVDPDIEVVDDPALMVGGEDPQLDTAIEHMLEEIKRNPYVPPERPPYPDRSGMGILEKDK
ncbi:MAG: peptidase S41 [Candidatus Latescibacteria bacterium]|nr:peptidase S41 [Candidatus Latescibacterota bacterium]NIM21167.1 peptidase S41 [Candidatus Latescibacterota bacterium]NIM65302.1 peptidase S41 [Candidatus Latescibacterota bacterium]NIO01817.1 peptidase S41 [Candidatus Latescibacterota bacterium]NIO28334.1 peptidase S41 [Candidatus Latescibacterota bacterium]